MKNLIIILSIVMLLFSQGYAMAGSCGVEQQCKCSQALCCEGGQCQCTEGACCSNSECICGQDGGCGQNCKCKNKNIEYLIV